MQVVTIFIFLSLLLLVLYLRVYPRLNGRQLLGTDTNFHFYYINLIKNNNNRMPLRETRIIGGSNNCTYPYFYHWLLSYLPSAALCFLDKYSAVIYDLICAVMVVWLLSYLMPINMYGILLIISCYLIAPGLTFSFIGPRAYSLTPRNFTQMLFCFACAFWILLPTISSNFFYLFFTLSAIFFSFVLLTSQFGLQVILFLVLAGLYDHDLLLIMIVAVLFAVFISKGFFIRQVIAQIRHLEWYYKYNYSFVKHKTDWKKLYNVIANLDLRGMAYEALFFNQILVGIVRHPLHFVSIILFLLYGLNSSNEVEHRAGLLLFIGLIGWLVTSFGKGRIFGEAERYLEFYVPIQYFLFFLYMSNISNIYIFGLSLLIYNLIFYLYNLYQIKKQLYVPDTFIRDAAKFIDSSNNTVLCLSNNELYFFLKQTKAKLVGFLVNISLEKPYGDFFKNFFYKYPFVNLSKVDDIVSQYSVTHLLINKNHINKYESESSYKKIVMNYKNIYENESYMVLKVI
jgi:hypothetical protein